MRVREGEHERQVAILRPGGDFLTIKGITSLWLFHYHLEAPVLEGGGGTSFVLFIFVWKA